MNEKYGIELEIIMQKFNEKINKVKKVFKGIEKQNIHVGFDGAQLEAVKIKMQELQGMLDANAKKPFMSSEEVLKTRVELEKLNRQYQKLSNNQDKINSKGSIGFNEMSKGVDKITSKIKRFALSLFSIRSIWALVSKASSAYLAQDTELAGKLQSVWASLGAMLAPVIEGIANILMKAVGYINIFIKALTGVDLLAKASAKSMDKAAKSAKGLNKSLAGFDELNNLDTDAGSNIDTGISNPFASIQNVELPWAETIKAFGEWCKENGPIIATTIGAIAGAVALIKLGDLITGLQKISDFFVSGTWKTVLGVTLVISGIVLGIMDLIDYIKSLDSGLENNGTSFKQFGKIITDIGLIITGLGILILGVPGIIAGVVTIIVGLIVSNWEKIKEFLQKGIDWIDSKMDWIGENFGIFGQWIAEIFKGAIQVVLNVFDGLFTGIKQIFDGILLIFKGDFKNGFINIGKGIVNILIGIINGATAAINAVLYPIRSLIVQAGKILGKNWTMSNISIPKIPLLDVGTNYVPEDQLAYIHKGEAVVPKKFNSQEYFGSGNEETNNLLERVIDAINNIEVNPYTTIKDVGQTAVNYINGKARQYGRSVI